MTMELGVKGYNLRPLWDVILELYEVFDLICKKYNLRYCADSGTALGAVRHNGFIPWDDDFDIQMPRIDYEKLVLIIQKELPSGYGWVDRFVCNEYEHGFGKIILSDPQRIFDIEKKTGLSLAQGIFIDIFPLDGYPDNRIARIWRKVQNRAFEIIPIIGKICRMLHLTRDGELLRIKCNRKLADLFERRAKRYRFGDTELCVSIGVSRWFDDKPFPFRYWGPTRPVAFDRTMIPVQNNYNGYLSAIFGDYKKLPPEEKRHPAHLVTDREAFWRLGIKK